MSHRRSAEHSAQTHTKGPHPGAGYSTSKFLHTNSSSSVASAVTASTSLAMGTQDLSGTASDQHVCAVQGNSTWVSCAELVNAWAAAVIEARDISGIRAVGQRFPKHFVVL